MTETEAFIAGWAARGRRDTAVIEDELKLWKSVENSATRDTARAIIKLLGRIPEPKPEEIK
jgi:hypothetical protein